MWRGGSGPVGIASQDEEVLVARASLADSVRYPVSDRTSDNVGVSPFANPLPAERLASVIDTIACIRPQKANIVERAVLIGAGAMKVGVGFSVALSCTGIDRISRSAVGTYVPGFTDKRKAD